MLRVEGETLRWDWHIIDAFVHVQWLVALSCPDTWLDMRTPTWHSETPHIDNELKLSDPRLTHGRQCWPLDQNTEKYFRLLCLEVASWYISSHSEIVASFPKQNKPHVVYFGPSKVATHKLKKSWKPTIQAKPHCHWTWCRWWVVSMNIAYPMPVGDNTTWVVTMCGRE